MTAASLSLSPSPLTSASALPAITVHLTPPNGLFSRIASKTALIHGICCYYCFKHSCGHFSHALTRRCNCIFCAILPLTLIYSILFPIELLTELQINGVNKCAGKRNRLRWLMMGLPWTECLERVDSLTSSHCYRSRARPTLSMHKTVLCKASKRPIEWKRATTTQIHSIYRYLSFQ
jgi:hypothetical protein